MEKTVIETVKKLCADGLEDDARVFVMDSIHELATAELWSMIDSLLAEVAADEFKNSPLVLLSFLASTTSFKLNLKRRTSLYLATKRVLLDKFNTSTVDALLECMN